MKLWGLEWSALDSYFQFVEQSASPSTPESNHIRLYAKDNGSGASQLCYKNDAGTETCLPNASIVTGSGAAGQVAFWDTASSITGENNLFWNATDNRLGIITATPLQPLDVRGNVRFGATPGFLYTDATQTTLIQGAGADIALDVRGTINNLLNISETGTTALFKFGAAGSTNAFLSCADNFIIQIDSNNDQTDQIFLIKHDAVSSGGTSLFSVAESGDVGACLPGGNLIIGGGATASRLRLLEASGSGTNYTEFVTQPQAANITYVLPADDGDAGEQLQTDGAGNLSWEAANGTNALLDASSHSDTVAQTVSRGSLIYGNATPKWDELVIGSAGAFLRNDGTDAMWSTLILPNAATSTRIVYASAANTYGESANLAFNGSDFTLGSGIRARMLSQNRFRYLNSLASVKQSGNQTGIAVNTWTALNFGAELFDTDGIHSTVTNNSRLTLPLVGKWVVWGAIYLDFAGITTPSQVGIRFHLNGLGAGTNDIFGYNLADAGTLATTGGIGSSAILVTTATTDYVEVAGIVTGAAGTWAANDVYGGLTNFGAAYIGE